MPSSARVALITGCGKPIGIGNSTARALAAAGVTVVVSDVAPAGLANEHNVQGDMDPNWGGVDSLVESIVRDGGTASAVLGDVSVEADAERMVQEVLRRYGRLDILVNNAGAPQAADRNEIEDVPVAAWDQVMGVECAWRFPDVARGGACDAQGAVGADHQRVVEGSNSAGTEAGDLCRVEGGDPWVHPFTVARSCTVRDHGERGDAGADSYVAGDQVRTGASMATIWKWGLPSGRRQFPSAGSAVLTRWRQRSRSWRRTARPM